MKLVSVQINLRLCSPLDRSESARPQLHRHCSEPDLARQENERGFREKPANAEKFFRAGRSGQWVDTLSPAQVREIVRTHAPMMQRFGYLPGDCGGAVSLARTNREL